jgi:orotate phosphoribosyltransferase
MEDLVQLLRQLDIVNHQPTILNSGQLASYYVDVKKALGYPEARKRILDGMLQIMDPDVTCVAGMGYGGISIAMIIANDQKLFYTAVREEPKTHGKEGMIEGYIPNAHDKVAIVDDVGTSGTSLNKIISAVEPLAQIVGCYAVVKRGEFELKYPLKYLTTAEELLR